MMIEDCRWTQIPNDFIDQGGIKIVGVAATCIYWCIIRKTKGWQKEKDAISYSQLEEMTGFNRNTLSKAIKKLLDNELIEAIKEKGKTTVYQLRFVTSTNSVLDQCNNRSTSTNSVLDQYNNRTSTSTNSVHTKETLKETNKINNNGVAEKVLLYLNQEAKRSFRPTKNTLKLIIDRLKEGFSEDDCKLMIRYMVWKAKNQRGGGDFSWQDYLNYMTLFRPNNFPRYLEEAQRVFNKKDAVQEEGETEADFLAAIREAY